MPLHSVGDAMHEYKGRTLHSGKGGPVVTSRKQAVAIGLSSERRGKRKKLSGKRPMRGRR